MNEQIRKLPIGIQSFANLRNDGYLYVDKTEYLYSLVHYGSQYFLSRPRRFGKSLFLSALKAYWDGREDLFKGLEIEELEKDNPDAWKKHPVFYFDFNRADYSKSDALEIILDAHLREWEAKYAITKPEAALELRFQKLLQLAAEQTKLRCVILIDEYDKPLLETLDDSSMEEHNKRVFKGFFSALKSYDDYIRFVMITGVTKFNKVSIFSDLNQLRDISLTEDYSGICGITDREMRDCFMPEISRMSVTQGLSTEECLIRLNSMYDGYHFHHRGESVYNPFSLLNALSDRDFASYWFSTGTPTFLVKKLKQMCFDIRKFTDGTLFATESILSDYNADNPDPVPLLYQTGYLTLIDYDVSSRVYILGFPNEEVKYGFFENLMTEYVNNCGSGSGKDVFTLSRLAEQGDTDGIRDILTAVFASIPYQSSEEPFEHYFQTVIYLVFMLLGKYVHCELHTWTGRIDCVVECTQYVYLFEFKRDDSADAALDQIERTGYALPYAADQRTLYKIGVNFDSTVRMLTEWKVRK